jgi:DNA-binding LytR/AlgR family response regulator
MKTIRKTLKKDYNSCISPFKDVHVGSRMEVNPTDIVMITADISYSYLYLKTGKKVIVSTNIQKLEERFLPFRNMVRIHRSTMINTQFLKYVDGSSVFLTNDMQCVISRRKKNDLLNAIQIINY